VSEGEFHGVAKHKAKQRKEKQAAVKKQPKVEKRRNGIKTSE
jgi:hypothetical protein